MQTKTWLIFLSSVSLSACSFLNKPLPPEPIKNPRIVERGLTPEPTPSVPISSRVASRSLVGNKVDLSKAEIVGDAITPEPAKPEAPPKVVGRWSVKPDHHSLREVIEDWATAAGGRGNPDGKLDVIWETRDFPIAVPREKVLSTGDIWDALTVLGEAYRDSDSAFQVQPTAFQQIVIVPMKKSSQTQLLQAK